MHMEILVEDFSGKALLESLLPKMVKEGHYYRLHSYKGLGNLPNDLKGDADPSLRILLDRLPKLLNGYGNTFKNQPNNPSSVMVVCDLDRRCPKKFRDQLMLLYNNLNNKPITKFCLAVQEIEAWYLGDLQALEKAFPGKIGQLKKMGNPDQLNDTWEFLADAIYPGGNKELKKHNVGEVKYQWAKKIGPLMDIENNQSASFQYFKKKIEELCNMG
ncbi:MAG: DUF4276 family protein [Magnetococcales bacterium]|nr:DUF4276 family protein [Magnetococcales bacterium]NGZ27194.1 DUF4276 family protein [Magnetococcales bacterium]